MASMIIPSNAKRAQVAITVQRADGTVEELGVVSYYHRNPLRRWAFQLRRQMGLRVPDRM